MGQQNCTCQCTWSRCAYFDVWSLMDTCIWGKLAYGRRVVTCEHWGPNYLTWAIFYMTLKAVGSYYNCWLQYKVGAKKKKWPFKTRLSYSCCHKWKKFNIPMTFVTLARTRCPSLWTGPLPYESKLTKKSITL